MAPTELPTTDREMAEFLAGGEPIPITGAAHFNWANRYPSLVDEMKAAFREDGLAGLRDATLAVALDVCELSLDYWGVDRDPTPEEVMGTAIHTVAIPSGTRNAFLRGAVSELLVESMFEKRGHTVWTGEEVQRRTGESTDSQESLGWDVTIGEPGNFTHFQVKATKTRPSPSTLKEADALVWYEVNGEGALLQPEVYDGDTNEWGML